MKIETKFDVGDSVVFLQTGEIWRREVIRIKIMIDTSTDNPIITYQFGVFDSGVSYVEKYESEIAKTKYELIELLPEK